MRNSFIDQFEAGASSPSSGSPRQREVAVWHISAPTVHCTLYSMTYSPRKLAGAPCRCASVIRWSILLGFVAIQQGCGSDQRPAAAAPTNRIVCFVPGVGGDGIGYTGLEKALRETGASDLRVATWGAPAPLFMLNFQSPSIHEAAEKKLAGLITAWRQKKPDCRIDLISHSAGGGVILGSLGRLGEGISVDHVVLLAPSVSPGYPLEPALRHVSGKLNLFYSDRDIVSLKWRTGTFGSYDNVRTPAAGHLGFRPATPLPAELAVKLVQHPYDPAWLSLGHDGGHAGTTAHDFVRAVAAPLLNANP